MEVGIEAINAYGGATYMDVRTLFEKRGLDLTRYDNLLMKQKAVGLPCEDPVTNGVNAAKPLIDQLSEEEKNKIQLVITSTESGIDFGKTISNYIHDILGLNKNCRTLETKQACFSGNMSFQLACSFVASNIYPGAKVLVVSTDVARTAEELTYAEPSQGTGAIAMLVSDNPKVMELDFGASGAYAFETMDTCRPQPDMETGDPDKSLTSYSECLKNSFKNYAEKVNGANFKDTFDYLAWHTPFGGMVKGLHRQMMRRLFRAKPPEIENDFLKRVEAGLIYPMQVGNVYSATVFLALCSVIDNAKYDDGFKRVGLFSYGSGCSSEFFSGMIDSQSKDELSKMKINEKLKNRYSLTMEEYDSLLRLNREWKFGIQDKKVDYSKFAGIYNKAMKGKGLLALEKISNFHREYKWS